MFRGCRKWLALLLFCLPTLARAADDDFQRGVKALQAKDYDLALSCFNAVLVANPYLAAGYEGRGLAYAGKQAYDRAVLDQTEAIRLSPKAAGTYYNRGNARLGLKAYEAAIADFTQALDINPNYAEALNNRGLTFAAKRDWDRAIADHTQAILLDTNHDATLVLNRGLDFQGKKDYDKAELDFSEAIRLDPKLALAYYLRGNIQAQSKEYLDALADYNETINLDPHNVGAWLNRGNVLVSLREYDRALADYAEAFRSEPRRAMVYFNRGLALAGKKDYDHALAEYEEAVRLDPELVWARSLIYADFAPGEAGPTDEAVLTFGTVYFERGSDRVRKKDYDGALADYARALRLAPGDARVLSSFVKTARAKIVAGDLPSFRPDAKMQSTWDVTDPANAAILPAAAWTPPEDSLRPLPAPAPLSLVSEDIPELPKPQPEPPGTPAPVASPRPPETTASELPARPSPAPDVWNSPALMFYSVVLAALITGVAVGSIPVLLLLTRLRKPESNAVDIRELVTVLLQQRTVPEWSRGGFPARNETRPVTPPSPGPPAPLLEEIAGNPDSDLIRNILDQNLKLREEGMAEVDLRKNEK